MKEYHYCVIVVERLDTKRHFAHVHDYPILAMTILKQQQGYKDMNFRASYQTWQILEILILYTPHSFFIQFNMQPQYKKSRPENPMSTESHSDLKDNYGPWMIVHYPKKRQNLRKLLPCFELLNHNKKPFSNPNVLVLSNSTNHNYPTPLEYKTNSTKSIWVDKSTPTINNTSRFHINSSYFSKPNHYNKTKTRYTQPAQTQILKSSNSGTINTDTIQNVSTNHDYNISSIAMEIEPSLTPFDATHTLQNISSPHPVSHFLSPIPTNLEITHLLHSKTKNAEIPKSLLFQH